jgi:hypothetical protein
MKKTLLLFWCFAMTVSASFATGAEVLEFNEQEINAEFQQLNQLESFVLSNEGVTLDEVATSQSHLTEGLNLEPNSIATIMAKGELPAGIPPFWWGFCLGWVGLLLVYILTDNDRDQVKKAFTGCLISAAIGVVFYVILWGLVLGNVAWLGSGL